MGMLANFFAEKTEIWRGSDMNVRDRILDTLKKEGIFHQNVKINQQTPKCDGNCGSCPAMSKVDEDAPYYEKIGSGCSSDILNPKGEFEIYGIYVKKSEMQKAYGVIAPILEANA